MQISKKQIWEVDPEKQLKIQEMFDYYCDKHTPMHDNFRIAEIDNGRFIRLIKDKGIATREKAEMIVRGLIITNHGLNNFIIIPMEEK